MYAKIFRQIFDSSIADNWKTRHVFEDLLKLANRDGIVDMTHQSIAAITRMPLDLVQAAIKELESPDPRSRSKEEDGRRIVRLDSHRDWGWKIVNHAIYRRIRTEYDRREYMRNYMKDRRLGKKANAGVNMQLTHANLCTVYSGSGSVPERGTGEGKLDAADNPNAKVSLPLVTKDAEVPFPEVAVPAQSVVKVNGADYGLVQFIRGCVCRKYNRPETDHWSYLEESALATVCARPNVKMEMEAIWQMHDSMGIRDKRFFPQSVGALLEKWTACLDKARSLPQEKSLGEKDAIARRKYYDRL